MTVTGQKTREQLLLELGGADRPAAGGGGHPGGHPQRRGRRTGRLDRPRRGAALHARGRGPCLSRLPRIHQRGRRHPRRRRADRLRQRGRAPAPLRRAGGAGRPPLQRRASARTSGESFDALLERARSRVGPRGGPRSRRKGRSPSVSVAAPAGGPRRPDGDGRADRPRRAEGDGGGARVRAARPVRLRAGRRADRRVRQGRHRHPREPGGGRAHRPGTAASRSSTRSLPLRTWDGSDEFSLARLGGKNMRARRSASIARTAPRSA